MSDLCASSHAVEEQSSQLAESDAELVIEDPIKKEAVETKEKVEARTVPGEEKLPKLNAAEFRIYNSLAEHMEYFHNHFRSTWNILYTACINNKRPTSMSLKQFVTAGLKFCSHLSTHHAIEEQHIFPLLASRMPEFKQGKNAAELLRQHSEIHAGMDLFEGYLKKCRDGETELDLRIMKTKMDTWGEVLWKHLDQEVKTLAAENMRKYWSVDDMRRMPL